MKEDEKEKLPYLHLYLADWQTDRAVQACSLGARGLWFEILLLCHQSDEYGFLSHNGQPMTVPFLRKLVKANPEEPVESYLEELRENGVFSVDERGCIFSRRLVRDKRKRETNRRNGRSGGNPVLNKSNRRSVNSDHQSGDQFDSNLIKSDQVENNKQSTQQTEQQEEEGSRITYQEEGGDIRNRDNDNDNDDDNDDDSSDDDPEFLKFWELYGKKVGRHKCLKKWSQISKRDKKTIFAHVPLYIESTPDVQFRKNPLTYLNGKHYHDEIVNRNSNQRSGRGLSVDSWSNFAKGGDQE